MVVYIYKEKKGKKNIDNLNEYIQALIHTYICVAILEVFSREDSAQKTLKNYRSWFYVWDNKVYHLLSKYNTADIE